MGELSRLFNHHRYLVSYTAYAGSDSEIEIQGKGCCIVSDRELNGGEIASELALHIQEQDGLPVRQVILHSIGQAA